MWGGILPADKLHKFFTVDALARSKDAWRDPDSKCVITMADAELEKLVKKATQKLNIAITPLRLISRVSSITQINKIPQMMGSC